MKKALLPLLLLMIAFSGLAQSNQFWSANNQSRSTIIKHKATARLTFPSEYKLFDLNLPAMRQELFKVVGNARAHSTIITLPNADGSFEKFEVVEASNFEPELQARFPEIRSFSGKGITDRYASLKLSISPQGIQTIVFRTGKASECIEAFSQDNRTYAVFTSIRNKGQLPWTCTTQDQEMFSGLNGTIRRNPVPESSAGQLKTMRLAQSCNGEYSNYFGAFNSTQVALVLAAFNATLTRCNGVYEKDFALHLNLIPTTTNVIYYDPNTDPYTSMGSWNGQLQATLTANIGEANYDIGHMFGASGGGGNAGCIGCVCQDGMKGRGITSPADGIPQGDNFDIDYVAHEVGHQLGANHTFSQSTEGTGVNKEVGSGITVMGYAGITAHDVAGHSIDIFHEASIQQVQVNLALKTCPITTDISAVNATPVVAPLTNYTIPISTAFALTGSATDANAGDALTYCWEQNDDGVGQTGTNSRARENKPTGPNWLTFPATANPTRTFPKIETILAGANTTGPLPGGDAGVLIEALSNVSRTLNFRLTVRDNSPYSSTAPVKVGQTSYADMVVTVTNTSGPFAVTSPNTNVSWPGGSTQTVTWNVNNTTAAPVSCASVRILLSTDGGYTFPTVLVTSTANDGSESVVLPNTTSTTARVKVESIGNIFFDISNSNFTITQPANGFSFNATTPGTVTCGVTAAPTISLGTTIVGTFNTPIVLTSSGAPVGTTVSFSPATINPGSSTTVTLNNANTLANGTYNITVTGTAGSVVQTANLSFVVSGGTAPSINAHPANTAVCAPVVASFSVTPAPSPAATGYQWQVNTGSGFTNIAGATSASYNTVSTAPAMNGYQYRVLVMGQCGTATSNAAVLTVNSAPAITVAPANTTVCAGSNASFSVTATGSGLTYQWQLNTGSGFNNISGATAASYTENAVTLGQNGHQYQVIVTGICGSPLTSSAATLNVGNNAAIANQPTSLVVCVGDAANFSVNATGSSLTYQWQVNSGSGFTDISGATASSYNAGPATAAQNGYQYRVNIFSCTPTPLTSNAVTLTVNTPASIGTQPAAVELCAGNDASFSVVASGTAVTYQWQVSTTGCGGTFNNIAGATSATLAVDDVIASQNGYAYRVVVSNSCNSITSSCVVLTVNTPIVVTSQPVGTSVCLPTSTASFSVSVTGTAPAYQWQVNTGSGFTNIAGATSATLNLTGLTAAMNGYQYRVVLSGTCTAAFNSDAVTLVVNTPVAITDQPDDASICEGDNVSFGVSATGSTITYQWQVRKNGGPFVNVTNAAPYSGATTATLSITNANVVLSGNEYRVIVSGVPCGAVNSDTVSLTVNPLPGVVLVAAEHNSLTPYNPTGLYSTVSPPGNYTYTWYKNSAVIAGQSGSYIAPVTVDWFGQYQVLVTDANGCSRTSNAVTIKDSVSNLLFIYPNPSKGIFQVRYYSAAATSFTLNVYDSRGARVWSKQYSAAARYEQMLVDLRRNAQGTYTVEVKGANGKRLASGHVVISR